MTDRTMADRIDVYADYLDRNHQTGRADALRRGLALQALTAEDRTSLEFVAAGLRRTGRRSLAAGIVALVENAPT